MAAILQQLGSGHQGRPYGSFAGKAGWTDPMANHLLKNDKLFVTRYRRRERLAG